MIDDIEKVKFLWRVAGCVDFEAPKMRCRVVGIFKYYSPIMNL
jgi:hypothetical protein